MTEASKLAGTVAIVTGASSGIGKATAHALARQGAAVCLAARRTERLEQVGRAIRDSGGLALIVATDLTLPEAPVALVAQCVDHFGRLDIMVNNAGLMLLGPVLDAPRTEWDRMLALNTQALLSVTHAALPHLITAATTSPRQVADLVNVSSAAGRKARAGSAVYNLTKFGLGAFSEALRQEVARSHVRVSLVEPGSVATELRTHMRPEVESQSAARFANVEKLQPSDVAEAIVYIVTRARRVAVNEVLIRPTEQDD